MIKWVNFKHEYPEYNMPIEIKMIIGGNEAIDKGELIKSSFGDKLRFKKGHQLTLYQFDEVYWRKELCFSLEDMKAVFQLGIAEGCDPDSDGSGLKYYIKGKYNIDI